MTQELLYAVDVAKKEKKGGKKKIKRKAKGSGTLRTCQLKPRKMPENQT